MGKNLDGIKKIRDEELKKSRKIVLDFIGEKVDDERVSSDISSFNKKKNKLVDSLFPSNNKRLIVKNKKYLFKEKNNKEDKKFIELAQEEVNQEIQEAKESIGAEEKKEEIVVEKMQINEKEILEKKKIDDKLANKQKEIRIKEKIKENRHKRKLHYKLLKKNLREEKLKMDQKKKENKIKIKENKKKEKEEKRFEKENRKLEKRRLKEKIKFQKKLLRKNKKTEREEKKLIENNKKQQLKEYEKIKKEENREMIRKMFNKKRNEFINRAKFIKQEIKKSINNIFNKNGFKKAGKFFISIIFFIIIFIIIFYVIFSASLLKLGFDNNISRAISKYAPVPAVITKFGFIEYYDYLDILRDLNRNSDINLNLAEEIILRRLCNKYNVKSQSNLYYDTKDILSIKFALDMEINGISYSRISKIYDIIKQGENFKEVGNKYGDSFGIIYDIDDNSFFKNKTLKLKYGEITDIIVRPEGYYLIKKELAGSQYIFIKASSLDEYINEKIEHLKIWILADS